MIKDKETQWYCDVSLFGFLKPFYLPLDLSAASQLAQLVTSQLVRVSSLQKVNIMLTLHENRTSVEQAFSLGASEAPKGFPYFISILLSDA